MSILFVYLLLLFSRNCVLLAHSFKRMIAGENKREVKKKKKKKKNLSNVSTALSSSVITTEF